MKKPRRPRKPEALRRRVLEELLDADCAPAELAGKIGLSLEELSTLGRDDRIVDALRGLVELAEIRAQVLLSRYRAHAAIRLIAIANAEEPSELARKACVDLLKMDLDHLRPAESDEEPSPNDAPPAPDEDAIVQALEALGGAGDD
jgi:hypothetical protein